MLPAQQVLVLPQALEIVGFFLTVWVKATAILAVAGALAALLKKSPASIRHMVWGIGLTALLALPILPFLLPQLNIPIWHLAPSGQMKQSRAPLTDSPDRAIQVEPESVLVAPTRIGPKPIVSGSANADSDRVSREAALTIGAAAPSPARGGRLRWSKVLLVVWLAGFLASLSRWTIGVLGASMVVRRSHPVAGVECIAELKDLADSLALRRSVRLLEYDGPSMPMTCGLTRPTIILPASHIEWPAERRRVVLLHELSHVRRWDCLAQAVAQIACAFYWLNPLAWFAARRLRLESENACDDAVIGSGTKASAYAAHLLDIARTFSLSGSGPRGVLTIARPSQLESRVRAILSPDRDRRRHGERLHSALLSLGLMATVLGLAAVTPYSRNTAMAAQTTPVVPEPGPNRAPASDPYSEKRISTPVGGQSINNAAMAPLTSDPAPSGGGVPYQDKSGNHEHTPLDGSQSIAEKDSTFISPRVAESYESSLAKQSVEVESDEQESDQKARSDEVVQALTTALKDKDPHVRLNAIWALASARGKIAQEALIAALSDEDARVRAQAAWGLGIHGDHRAISALKGLLNNPDDHIRRQAAWALGMLLMRSSDAENEEEEPESDGDVIHRVHIRPHPIPNPRVNVNVSPRPRPAN